MVVASHDRYLVERVCDTVVGMFGDGRLRHLPGGVTEYLALAATASSSPDASPGSSGVPPFRPSAVDPTVASTADSASIMAPVTGPSAGESRTAKKEMARLERQVGKLEQRAADLHERLATHATDYQKVTELDAELRAVEAERASIEDTWLTLADQYSDS